MNRIFEAVMELLVAAWVACAAGMLSYTLLYDLHAATIPRDLVSGFAGGLVFCLGVKWLFKRAAT